MLTRSAPGGYLLPRTRAVSTETLKLEQRGVALLPSAFSEELIYAVRSEIEQIYDEYPVDERGANKPAKIAEHFRYEMFNRGALSQKLVGRREILDVIEPLIGEDCHIIANTCWRNPPNDGLKHGGGGWHIDGGPHIPLRNGVVWPKNIPHPVFAVGVHIYLEDCPISSGPTAAIPGSHLSGRFPPQDKRFDTELTWNGTNAEVFVAKAGDILMFVSDVWHRRMPPKTSHPGRFFLQVHYARRDIAQRVKTTSELNHVDSAALSRIESERERLLLGLHAQGFYDG